MTAPLLRLTNLKIAFEGSPPALDGVDLAIRAGERWGVVGESGSGKSLMARAALGLVPEEARLSGEVAIDGAPIGPRDHAAWTSVRGARLGFVFQEPMSALDPLQRIGQQLVEGALLDRPNGGRAAALSRAEGLMRRVGLPFERHPPSLYPHQLSGGQRQRLLIAIALMREPALLIADEPTTALDSVTQREILDLLASVVEERAMALLLISHDIGVVARAADRLVVMKKGAIVERGAARDVLRAPREPYTRALLEALPPNPRGPEARAARTTPASSAEPLLVFEQVSRTHVLPAKTLFGARRRIEAARAIDFALRPGEATALVGGSGAGKSTIARLAVGLDRPSAGRVRRQGSAQLVFQDPWSSLDPRWRAGAIVTEPLWRRGLDAGARRDRAREALDEVGLGEDYLDRVPHALSGGQRQRLAIARALIDEPATLIADEPVSALDLEVRKAVLDLLMRLVERRGLALLFISHDLAVVRERCADVLVLDRGRIVEKGPVDRVFDDPCADATKALLDAHLGVGP